MIRSSFRLAPGVGPWMEARLWEAGITRWAEFPPAPAEVLSRKVDDRIRAAIARAQAALAAGDADALAAMLPRTERWRLYAAFAADAAFLDVEQCGEELTCVGVLDASGPRIFLRGGGGLRPPTGRGQRPSHRCRGGLRPPTDRGQSPIHRCLDLEDFPAAAQGWKLLVTFNGQSFDVPALKRAFPGWRPPRAHVDLCHLWRRLGHAGGLKLLERETGVGRPPNLEGLDGRDAVRLWQAHEQGDREALRLFAEYNLHDAVNLRPLMDLGYNRMIERLRLPAAPVSVAERGDFRYDLSKLLLEL